MYFWAVVRAYYFKQFKFLAMSYRPSHVALASACEQTHGEAVLNARAMHQIFSDQEFESVCLGQRGDRSAMPVASADAYTLYPNPTTGMVYLSDISIKNQPVLVFDILGVPVLNTDATDGQVDLSTLNNGIYFIRVLVSDVNQAIILKAVVQK